MTSYILVRNRSYAPDLSSEGVYLCPMPAPPPVAEGLPWFHGLKPHERLYYNQTMNAVRKSKRFRQTPMIPKDSLDYQLQGQYVHSREVFPERIDIYLQHETCRSESTFRVLRNVRRVAVQAAEFMGHPIKFGCCKEKISPHSVKLMCSGPHASQLVNNGYSRQPSDGNFFRY